MALALHGPSAQTNFPAAEYMQQGGSIIPLQGGLAGLTREELQRALGVKPQEKSSQFRGVSRKKGKWEAKVMVNNKWAFRGGWRCGCRLCQDGPRRLTAAG